MGLSCMAQETQTGALYPPRRVGKEGRWEGVSKGRGYMYTYGWFMLWFDTKQQNSVKQLSFNKNKLIKNKQKNRIERNYDKIKVPNSLAFPRYPLSCLSQPNLLPFPCFSLVNLLLCSTKPFQEAVLEGVSSFSLILFQSLSYLLYQQHSTPISTLSL